MLERLSLSDAGDHLVRDYSGGMRRHLDLGASVVGRARRAATLRCFVLRTEMCEDRRIVRVRLTDTGFAAIDGALVDHLDNEASILASLSARTGGSTSSSCCVRCSTDWIPEAPFVTSPTRVRPDR